MANEIRYTLNGSVTNGSFSATIPNKTVNVTQAAQGAHETTVSVGTSEEDLTLGDLTTPGIAWLCNLDTTNFVKYGPKSAGAMVEFGRLKPGEPAIVRFAPSGLTLRWVADTAPCKVQIKIFEN